VSAQALLTDYGFPAVYETLLELLGCAWMSREDVEQHLAPLAAVFDAAKTMIKTPFFFASDISDVARPIAIDGSRELIESGCHREAIFWMVATYARCQKVLYQDAPAELRDRYSPGFRQLLAALGVNSPTDFPPRNQQIRAFLPQLWEVTEAMIAANPEIED
jgi:hypothetical protein